LQKIERVTYSTEWLDNVISQGKMILTELAKDTFQRYRQMGILIINSGYKKGQWHNEDKQYACSEWDISDWTFSKMVELGTMPNDEFCDVITKFGTIFNWTHKDKKEKQSNFEYPLYNVWKTFQINDTYGQDYPGRTPHEIITSLLYYYTNEGDTVLDPMAGGGTTIDVCKTMNRLYRAFDIKPVRDDIEQNDILTGIPHNSSYDFVFLDPPYFNLMKEYPDNDFTRNYESFLHAMRTSLINIEAVLKPKGKIAILLKPMNQTMLGGDWFDLTIDTAEIAKELGYKLVKRISAPLSTQQFQKFDVSRAKEQKVMLNVLRDILILEKN